MPIVHNRDFDPHYGECVQVAPLVRRVVAENPNPFTFTGSGVYLVGRGDVAVIDPGPNLETHLDAIEACLGPGESIERILVTHTHTDHTAGVPALKARTAATTYGFGPHGPVSADDPLDRLDFSTYISADERDRFEREWADLPDELKREGPDIDFVPDVVVGHGRVDQRGASGIIEGRGWSIEVIHTPGHTSNHICLRLLNDGAGRSIVFTGDHVMGWATSVISPPDGDLTQYLASLKRLLLVADDAYLPTHGPAIENPHPYVKSFIEHRDNRTQQLVQGLKAGPSKVVDIVPRMYAEVDKRLWRAAGSSVFAHLLALRDEDQAISVDGSDSITSTWRLTNKVMA
jgi:glyoxylase-like metal-dependent hydrolase (beta-lactamase superfamily II)